MWGPSHYNVKAIRSLLQGGATEDPPALMGEEEQPEEDFSDQTLNLRIASIFIILAAGMLGGLPPLFSKTFQNPDHWLPRIMRAMAAGIILALGLIHIYPEAVIEMESLTELMGQYPYNPAGVCAVFGVLLMIWLDCLCQSFMANRQATRDTLEDDTDIKHKGPPPPPPPALLVQGPHAHVCVGPAQFLVNPGPNPTVHGQVSAILFELGCIFHSVIIGIALGVNTEALSQVRSLLIALCFHQWLEGIALGSFIMRARLGKWKGITMVVVYSLTCPIGVAIGLAVSGTYDPESTTAIVTQGVFNGVSAGMLLYISLVQLIAEDFACRKDPAPAVNCNQLNDAAAAQPSRDMSLQAIERGPRGSTYDAGGWQFWACHAALAVGAACMAVLAIWA